MHAPDADRLLAESLRGPSTADARSSLAYWRRRRERLPLHRIRARREAHRMVATWEERLRRAELERCGGGPIGQVAGWVAVLRGERLGAIAGRVLHVLVPSQVVRGFVALAVISAVAFGFGLALVVAGLLG